MPRRIDLIVDPKLLFKDVTIIIGKPITLKSEQVGTIKAVFPGEGGMAIVRVESDAKNIEKIREHFMKRSPGQITKYEVSIDFRALRRKRCNKKQRVKLRRRRLRQKM